jgi:hypothetical protein
VERSGSSRHTPAASGSFSSVSTLLTNTSVAG